MATVLIVDDSILMRRNLKILLTEAGHEVVAEAANGIEAYKEYTKWTPDIVTMDITMPVMSGIDAVKKIIASYPDANIIMISALDQRSMVFEAIQNGAKHYILKPITSEKVLGTINEVLELDIAADEAAAEAAAVEEEPVDHPNVQPFEIVNKNGVFIVTIRSPIGDNDFTALAGAINSFQFIKPLKVVFHIPDADLSDEALQHIADYANIVVGAGGTAKTVASGKLVVSRLKKLNEQLFHTVYNDLAQIVL
jgi:DNA-binding NarL/FixJ family response regulator